MKKAISPLVGVSLLLFISIAMYLVLRVWFFDVEGNLVTELNKVDIVKEVEVLKLNATNLIINNKADRELLVNSIIVDSSMCTIEDNLYLDIGENLVSISSCTSSLSSLDLTTVILDFEDDSLIEAEVFR